MKNTLLVWYQWQKPESFKNIKTSLKALAIIKRRENVRRAIYKGELIKGK